jgi:hypothetical protein
MPSIAEIGGSPGGVNGGKRKREMTMEEEIEAKLARYVFAIPFSASFISRSVILFPWPV